MSDKCKRCGAYKECGAPPGGYQPWQPGYYPYQVYPYPAAINPYPLGWNTASCGSYGTYSNTANPR